MRRILVCAAALLAIAVQSAVVGQARAAEMDMKALHRIAQKYPFAIEVGKPGTPSYRFLYADTRAHIHVYRVKDGRLDVDWETTNLGSRATSLFVTDLYHDGNLHICVSTTGGRILLYTMKDYDLEWENLDYRFDHVSYMVAANLDNDPQDELVFIADGLLYFMDSLNRTIEWQSQTKFEAKQILIGNVDEDKQPEVILNTGTIIDSRFYNIEFQADSPFGDRISLLDINGDGFPEIIGEFFDNNVKVFDVYAERELW